MLRKVAAGLAGLGLIGGAGGAVIHDSSGALRSVQTFSCPAGINDKVKPYDVALGRIDLTLRPVRRAERAIERQYPSHHAPLAVLHRYEALQRRDDQLVSAYNREVDRRNALIHRDCTQE